jgi:hypothetical protein
MIVDNIIRAYAFVNQVSRQALSNARKEEEVLGKRTFSWVFALRSYISPDYMYTSSSVIHPPSNSRLYTIYVESCSCRIAALTQVQCLH